MSPSLLRVAVTPDPRLPERVEWEEQVTLTRLDRTAAIHRFGMDKATRPGLAERLDLPAASLDRRRAEAAATAGAGLTIQP